MTLAHPADDGHFVMVPLTRGKFAIVDEGDAELIRSEGPWYAIKSRHTYYARAASDIASSMHVIIAGHKGVDHANRNGLDNRRINLRPATPSQQTANQRLRSDNRSGYKGVSWNRDRRKWVALIMVEGRRISLGAYEDPVEAARMYNQAAVEAFGEYAWLNPV